MLSKYTALIFIIKLATMSRAFLLSVDAQNYLRSSEERLTGRVSIAIAGCFWRALSA
jgi:hypothetical protein